VAAPVTREEHDSPSRSQSDPNKEDKLVLVVEPNTRLELTPEAAATLARIVRTVLSRPRRDLRRGA
jgi:hypothetical protein